ncbi:MAG TPA: lactonase family protein [Terracidiphilus sp.]|nr:lactonase family protein [Terracidiphilus sp.]
MAFWFWQRLCRARPVLWLWSECRKDRSSDNWRYTVAAGKAKWKSRLKVRKTHQMTRQGTRYNADPVGKLSRRAMLKGATALAAGYAAPGPIRALGQGRSNRKRLAYAGTYNSPVDGGAGNGKGIYLFEMDSMSGELTVIKLAAEARNPSWLSLDPSGRYLYSVNEISDFEGRGGSVSAYAVDSATGDLRLLNRVSSEGAAPAHLSVDASGRFVFVANYNGGSIAVLSILASGEVGPATYTQQDKDFVGSKMASNAPPGSFAISGHDRTHAHMIHSDPSNRFVLHTDLGQDRIYVDKLDRASGKLTPAGNPGYGSVPDGDGPRHFVFHGNGRWLYSLQEEASTVAFFLFDPETGALTSRQTLSTLPPHFRGTSFTSEILFSPDERFLYAANRLHDTIAVFALELDGRLTYVGETPTEGDYPRYLGIDPSGTFMYACNQRSDDIACFRLDRKTGLPSFTGQYTSIGSPTCIVFAG